MIASGEFYFHFPFTFMKQELFKVILSFEYQCQRCYTNKEARCLQLQIVSFGRLRVWETFLCYSNLHPHSAKRMWRKRKWFNLTSDTRLQRNLYSVQLIAFFWVLLNHLLAQVSWRAVQVFLDFDSSELAISAWVLSNDQFPSIVAFLE